MEKAVSLPFTISLEILEHLVDPAMVIGKDFRLMYLNQAARGLAGTEDNGSGGLCHDIIHHRDQPCHFYGEPCPVKQTIETREGVKVVRRYFDTKNEEKFREIATAPILDQTEDVEAVIVLVRELESSGLLARLEASEQRYKNMMASSPNGGVIINSRGIVVDCNPAVERLFGVKPRDLIGRPATVLMPERFRQPYEEGLAEAVHEGAHKYLGKTVELTGWRDDQQKEFAIALTLSSWREGEELLFAAFIVDSSKQHALENSLQREKKRLEKTQANLKRQHVELKNLFKQVEKAKEEWERTMDCIGDMVMLVSRRDRVLRCNKAVTDFCGISYAQLLGKNWEDLLLGHGMETNYARGEAIELFHRPSGRWFLLNVYDYAKKSHAAAWFVITVHETTRLKQIAEELSDKNVKIEEMMDILEAKNRELEDAYEELKATQAQILQQEKMASIGQLAAGVAHELNNPLGFIASNLGTLQKYLSRLLEFIEAQSQAVPADQADKVAEARRRLKIDYVLGDTADLIKESLEGADRLKKIIRDLKSFSRVDQAEFTHADIGECLESTINIVWNELKYKATVVKDYGELPLTKCYPQQLNQVFMNLLVNASQAIEKQGEIRIKTWCEGGFIFVAISDTGCGIPEKNLERIFEPFFTTKEVGKGTGLGLSITYDIIKKKHQGEITVESEAGKGTTFTVKIPVVEGR